MRRELIESYYEEYQRELERFLESDPEMFTLEAEIHHYIEILEIEVKATDSSRGITAVISGECDFAMSSRELKDYEAELLETKVIGKDAIAIVINEENPLENLTIKQLTGLYNGTYKNWDDLS